MEVDICPVCNKSSHHGDLCPDYKRPVAGAEEEIRLYKVELPEGVKVAEGLPKGSKSWHAAFHKECTQCAGKHGSYRCRGKRVKQERHVCGLCNVKGHFRGDKNCVECSTCWMRGHHTEASRNPEKIFCPMVQYHPQRELIEARDNAKMAAEARDNARMAAEADAMKE